jgi:hypothetical protein
MPLTPLLLAALTSAGAESIADAYPPPTGAQRVEAGPFGRWLQKRSLKPEGSPIRTHDGRRVPHDGRPVALDLVRGDLQQCADSAIRLRAEWLRQSGASSATISFFATSGDPLPWDRYAQGEQPYVLNEHIAWRKVDREKQTWEGWLSAVFTWAGTRSLAAYETRAVDEPRPGDLLVEGGSPGHAAVILDVAVRGEQIYLLLGEGFMPAQDFHVEHGPASGWWAWESDGVDLGHWHMGPKALRRWK